jgi:hypothetical protein
LAILDDLQHPDAEQISATIRNRDTPDNRADAPSSPAG